jgi:phage-related protein
MPRVQVFSASLSVTTRGIEKVTTQLNSLNKIAEAVESSFKRLSSVSINFRTAETQIDKFKSKVKEIGELSGQELVIGKGGGLFDSPIRSLEEFALAFKDTFGDLGTLTEDELKKATQEAAASIGVLSSSVTTVLTNMSKRNPNLFKFIPDSAEEAYDVTVGNSIIPDMIDAIEREFQRMPPAFAVQSAKLKREFEDIRATMNTELNDDTVPNLGELISKAASGGLAEKNLLADANRFFGSLSRSLAEAMKAPIAELPATAQLAFREIQQRIESASIGDSFLDANRVVELIEEVGRAFDTKLFQELKEDAPQTAAALEGNFREALDKIDKQLNVFPQVKGSIDRLKVLRQELRTLSDTSRELSGTSKVELVDITGVREGFLELESGIRNLKTKFSPEVIAFRQDLIQFREEWKSVGKVGGTSIDDLQSHMRSLTKTFQDLQEADAGEALQKALDKAEGAQQKAAKKQEERDAKREAGINKIVADIGAINQAGQETESTFSRVSEGLSLAFSTPGARLEGLREAIFGTASSTNVLARGFDYLISRGDQLGAIENRLIQSSADLAIQVSHGTASLKDQANEFRKLTQAELGNVNVSEEFNKRLTKLAASLDQVAVTAESGGDISRSLIRANTEVRRLEDQYSRLIKSGLIPVGTKSREVFDDMIKQARDQQRAVQAIAVRYQANEQALEKAKTKQEQMNASAEKSIGIFTRFRLIFGRGGGIFGQLERDITINTGLLGKIRFEFVKLFGIVSKESKAASQGIKQVEQQMTKAQKAASIFKAVFLGAFSGTAIGSIFSRLIPDGIDNLIFGVINKIQAIPAALIGAASNAAETQNKFDAVFKGMETQAEAFVAQLASDVGRDPFKLKDGLSSIQAFSVGLGLLPDQAFSLSTSVQSASLDLASFFNISDSDALDKIRAALAGSGEVLDQYGINTREAALEQEALSLGINKSSADLSEQEKVMLRWSIIAKALESQGAMGDAVETSTSFANQTKAATAQLQQFATSIGTIVLPLVTPFLSALRNLASDVFPVIISVVQSATTALQPFAETFANFIGNLGSVDYAGIFSAVLGIINDLTGNIGVTITNLIDQARDWGGSFMGELGNGILDAASSVLDAVWSIASEIASLLAPGSPPEKGPLSTIDKWGKPLSEQLTDGMVDGLDTGALEKGLKPIAGLMTGETGPLSSLLQQRKDLLDRLKRASDLGLDTTFLNQQLEEVQGQIDSFQDSAVDAKVAAKGLPQSFTSPTKVGGGGGGGGRDSAGPKEREPKETFQDKFAREKTALEERKRLGLISQADFLKEMLKLEKDYVEDSQKEGITAGLEEHVASIKSLNQQAATAEKAELQAKFSSGIISQEEYTKELLKIDEKYAADKLALGEQLSADEIKNIQDLQAEVESFKKKGKGGGVDQTDTLFAKIFGVDQAGDVGDKVKEVATNITNEAVDTIGTRIKAKFQELKSRIAESLAATFTGAIETMQAKIKSLSPAEFFPFLVLTGALSFPFVEGALKAIDLLFKAIVGLPKAFAFIPRLIGFFAPVIRLLFRFSLAGLVVVGIIQDWDNIVVEAKEIWEDLSRVFGTLTENIKQIVAPILDNQKLVDDFGASWSYLGTIITQVIGLVVKVIKKAFKVGVIGSIVVVADAINNAIEELGGAATLGERISTTLGLVFSDISDVLLKIANSIGKLFDGNITGAFTSLKEGLATIDFSDSISSLTSLGSDIISAVFEGAKEEVEKLFVLLPKNIQESILSGLSSITGLGTSISEALFGGADTGPSPIVQTLIDSFDRLKTSFKGFLDQGKLGGQFTELFTALKNLATTVGPPLLNMFTKLAIVIGIVIAVVIDVVASLAVAVVDTLPFVISAFSGIVQVITGVIQGVTGFAQLLQAAWAAVTGDTQGASDLFNQAVTNIGLAISNVFGGIITTISNVGLAILTFISSFTLNFIGFALSLIPGFENAGAQILAFKDYVIGLFINLSDQVMATINTLVTLFPQVVAIMVDKVVGYFTNLYTELVGESIIPLMVEQIISWIDFLVSDLPAKVLDLVNGIIDTFDEGLEKLENVGRNIMEGLVKGMENAKNLVLEFIKSLITDDIIGSIKQKLGIQSPSVVMADLGEDTMGGFLKGMEEVAPSFSKFIASTTKEMTKAFFPIVGDNKQLRRAFANQWRINGDEAIQAMSELEAQGKLTAESMEASMERISGKQLIGPAAEGLRRAAPKFIAEFRKLREESLRAFHAQEIERGLNVLDTAGKLVAQFDKHLQNIRGTALTSKNILENMLGKDLDPEQITEMALAIQDAGGAQTDQDKAILDAAKAQEKFNGALEQQKRIQEQVAILEQKRAKLDFLKSQLDLLKQAKEANLGPEIIAGLQLGADAPVDKILESMGKITDAIIQKAQKDLKISSPSGVFKGFGMNITTTLADTLKSGATVVAKGMQFVTDKLVNVPAIDANLSSLTPIAQGSLENLPSGQSGRPPINVTYNVGSNMDLAMVRRQTLDLIGGVG